MRPVNQVTPILMAAALIAASCGGQESLATAPPETGLTSAALTPTSEVTTSTESIPSTTTSTLSVTTATEAPTTTQRVCRDVEPGVASITISSGDSDYEVLVFVPTSAADGRVMPLVLDFHGRGSNGFQQTLLSSYEGLAESEGFIVAHPTGFPGPGSSQNIWELIQFDLPDRDDLAFANSLIDTMIDDFCADANRVYSTGMSNGGLFTSRLVCEMSDRIAAASSVAGVTHPDECEPSRTVPFIAFHGTGDEVVPYDGRESDSSLESDIGASGDFFDQVMPDEFAEFALDMGCSAVPVISQLTSEVRAHDYEGCQDDVQVTFFEIEGGGHTWPGSPIGVFLEDTLGHTTLDINATTLSWEFFAQYSLEG